MNLEKVPDLLDSYKEYHFRKENLFAFFFLSKSSILIMGRKKNQRLKWKDRNVLNSFLQQGPPAGIPTQGPGTVPASSHSCTPDSGRGQPGLGQGVGTSRPLLFPCFSVPWFRHCPSDVSQTWLNMGRSVSSRGHTQWLWHASHLLWTRDAHGIHAERIHQWESLVSDAHCCPSLCREEKPCVAYSIVLTREEEEGRVTWPVNHVPHCCPHSGLSKERPCHLHSAK